MAERAIIRHRASLANVNYPNIVDAIAECMYSQKRHFDLSN